MAVRNVLEDEASLFSDRKFTIFLQGSYGNDTNVYRDSDVDIVIRLDSAFNHDLTKLSDQAKASFRSLHRDSPYNVALFKADVTKWLLNNYQGAVGAGSKAIKIAGDGNRRDADVLPCISYRRYLAFTDLNNQSYVDGILLRTTNGTHIVNYPKQHAANLTAKHQETNGWLKPMIRIVKNMRNRMLDEGVIDGGLAPSYYLEGLLYNVPAEKFEGGYVNAFVSAFNWIVSADRSKFLCANRQTYLIADGSGVSWPVDDADRFLTALGSFWNDWK
jgi:hypothetical protein